MSLMAWKLLAGQPGSALWLLELPPGSDSFEALDAWLPAGAYTTLRTFAGDHVLELGAHLQRLEESAALAGQPVQLDRARLRGALRLAVGQASGLEALSGDLRIRLVLDLSRNPGDVYVLALPLVTPPPQAYQQGVHAITTRAAQRHNPAAKLTSFIAPASQLRQGLPPGVEEAIMVDAEERLLEGLSSNFFAIKDGQIRTAGQGVLAGTTRALVLAVIAGLGLPVRLDALRIVDLPAIQEAFITSASRAILPVRQINDLTLPAPTPGALTQRLMDAYQQEVAARLERI